MCVFASMQIGMEQRKTGSEKISLNCLDVTFNNHLQKFMAEKKIKGKRIEVHILPPPSSWYYSFS